MISNLWNIVYLQVNYETHFNACYVAIHHGTQCNFCIFDIKF